MALAEKMIGNVGVVATGEMGDVKEKIKEFVVPAPAKAGAVAQVDVTVPAGPTGMEPSQTTSSRLSTSPPRSTRVRSRSST